jgi:hypothetical protein
MFCTANFPAELYSIAILQRSSLSASVNTRGMLLE